MNALHLQSPAKLNLALGVGAPGPDRMHPVSSWMITIDLFDDIEIIRRDQQELSMYAVQWHKDALHKEEIDWPLKRDLSARAHAALEQHIGEPLPVRLKVEKRIPLGSGLGGGSSNAAAVLRGTNELFELGLSIEELAKVGASLGSDVPFLVHGGSALVGGLGEQVEVLDDMPEIHAVVALPGLHCDTARVFGWFDDLCEEKEDTNRAPRDARALLNNPLSPEAPFNDLAEAAFRSTPELQMSCDAITALAERPAHVSGSGSSLFVLCDEPIHAEALATAIMDQLGIPTVVATGCTAPNPLRR